MGFWNKWCTKRPSERFGSDNLSLFDVTKVPIFKPFDGYTLRARITPALLASLPSLALPFVLVPWDHLGLSNAIVSVMSFLLLFAFADVARRMGLRVEQKLNTRATPELWYRSDNRVPNASKDQYRAFIATKIKKSAPSEADEINNPTAANDFYAAAALWLRDNTRDKKKFNLLYDELVTYGYRRNLLGLKPVAILANIVVMLVSGAIIYFYPSYFQKIPYLDEKLVILSVAVVFHSLFMLLAVSKQSVRDASITYGTRLIESCGAFTRTTRSPRTKSAEA